MSFHSLLPRLPKKAAYSVAERFEGLEVYLASGGHTLLSKSREHLDLFLSQHWEFVGSNADALALVTEVDDPRLEQTSRDAYRDLLGDRFVPVWLADRGIKELERLADSYAMVGLRSDTLRSDPIVSAKLRPLTARYGTQWHLLDGARPDELMAGRVHSAATTAWLAPMRNGETIAWDGNRMHRYPKAMADQARRRHRAQFIAAGFDADKILEGDYQEITRYTVSAFIAMENYLTRKEPVRDPFQVYDGSGDYELATNPVEAQGSAEPEPDLTPVDNNTLELRNASSSPTKRTGPLTVMPVFGAETVETTEIGPDGEQKVVQRVILRSQDQSLRQCDSCAVAGMCPVFQAGAECGLGIPVDLKTKDQIFGTLVAVLEMQVKRVGFMVYQEELNGGYADPNTSLEMERLYKMSAQLKELQEHKESVRFSIEANTSGGVMSQLFGEGAAVLRQLDQPVRSDDIIEALVIED